MQSVIVHLLDITPMMGVLQGVVMEIEDMSLPLVKGKIFYPSKKINMNTSFRCCTNG